MTLMPNNLMHNERVTAASILVLIGLRNSNWFYASLQPSGTRQ
jgi:hypothetical protein